jgi:uncharacterized protein (DUF58 family)
MQSSAILPHSDIRQSLFSRGVKIEAANLVRLRELASQLPLRQQKRVLNDLAGTHTSPMRGRGIDFSEVRQYQPGDDIRAMDWRVTARTGEPHIKLFREERERPVMMVCDLRANMQFATRTALKSVLAADIAALLSWSALANGDRIGALLFNDLEELDLRPKTGRKQVLQLLHALAEVPPSAPQPGPARMQQICRHLRRVVRPGSALFFISDWYGFDDECERQLFAVSRHSELTAIRLYDPMEAELPAAGLLTLTDGQQRAVLDGFSSRVRQAHQQAFSDQQQALEQHMQRLKVPLISVATNDDAIARLRQGFGFSGGS